MSIQEFENAFISEQVKISIQEFEDAFHRKDGDTLFTFMPPKILQTMARSFDVEPENLVAILKNSMRDLFKSVEIISFEVDLEKAVIKTTPSGKIYSLIPTNTVMRLEEIKMSAEGQTLAFVDDGVWYLVSLSEDEGIQFLKEAYPDFKREPFKKATIEIIED